jgi:hypothetical protein
VLRLLSISILAALALAAPAHAAGTVDYVRGAQNRDGGFGMTQSGASSQLATGWALLGLAAAGQRPGPAALAYRTRAGSAAATCSMTFSATAAATAPSTATSATRRSRSWRCAARA